MDLSGPQRRAVVEPGPVVVEGLPGSGRTTALVGRFFRLLGEGLDPGRLLWLVRNGEAAMLLRARLALEVGRSLRQPLVTTPGGLAGAELPRTGARPRRVLSVGEARALVAQLLAGDDDGAWPGYPEKVRALPGFADALALFCREALRRGLSPGALKEELASTRPGWEPASRFFARYLSHLDRLGLVDPAGALSALAAADQGGLGLRFDAVLVDEAEAAPPALVDVLRVVRPDASGVAMAWSPPLATSRSPWALRAWLEGCGAPVIQLSGVRRASGHLARVMATLAEKGKLEAGPGVEVHVCAQLVEEAEGIAAVIVAEAEAGTSLEQMAVVGRAEALDAVERAVLRAGVPVRRAGPQSLAEHWAVQPLLAALDAQVAADGAAAFPEGVVEWWSGIESSWPVDRAVYELWLAAPHFVEARQAALAGEQWAHGVIDAAVRLLGEAEGFVERRPEGSRAEFLDAVRTGEAGGGGGGVRRHAVALLGPGGVGGRDYEVLAVAGATDSLYPGRSRGGALFDLRVLDPGGPLATARAEVADGRARFLRTVASASRRLVVTASLDLRGRARLSRFVADRTTGALPRRRRALGAARRVASDPSRPRAERLGAAAYLAREGVDPATWWGTREWTSGPPVPVGVLSHSSIAAYDNCPLAWLYERGLRLREADSHYAAHGTLIHALLEDLTRGELDRAGLVAAFEARFDPTVFPSAPVAAQFRRDGRKTLEAFLASPESSRFRAVGTEESFSAQVGGVEVTGRIDRVEELTPGLVRIVDYKTGRLPPRKDEEKVIRQLQLYLVGAARDPRLAELGTPRDAQLWYLQPEGVTVIPASLAEGDVQAVDDMVARAAEGIGAGRFTPTPSFQACRRCDYRHLCPTQPEGREVAP